MSEVILYDLPSKGRCACWSFNPWKTRLVLNLKGIPYQTQWLEYPDIAPTFEYFGIRANAEGTPYTIPAISIGDAYTMDSLKIAAELEKRYPSPSLNISSPKVAEVDGIINESLGSLMGVLAPNMVRNLLNPESVPHVEDRFSHMCGMPLEQIERDMGGGDAWKKATPVMKKFGTLLKAESGPFLLGDHVSYADLVLVAFLQFMKRTDKDIYERAVGIEPALKDLYEVSKAWLERDDH